MSDIETLSQFIRESHSALVTMLKRLEAKVDKTNGRVRDIEDWRIAHETAEQTVRKMNIRREGNYTAPLLVAAVTGVIILGGEFVLGKLL